MKFLELMQKRYTTKAYNPSKPANDALVTELMESIRLAPSSINSQPWGFKLVSDPTLKAKLAEHSYFNAQKILDSSHLVVLSVYKDPATFEAERLHNMDARTVEFYQNFKATQGEEQIMTWLSRQVYIALGTLLVGAAAEGIDSTPLEGIDTAAYAEVLGLDKYKVLVAVALGTRQQDDSNQPHITPKNRRTDAIL